MSDDKETKEAERLTKMINAIVNNLKLEPGVIGAGIALIVDGDKVGVEGRTMALGTAGGNVTGRYHLSRMLLEMSRQEKAEFQSSAEPVAMARGRTAEEMISKLRKSFADGECN